ncbi:MAG: tagaturonate reductase [Clostridia bacterium]|nr:tagaturonate reductase [Clostridia bacterium]
MNTLNATLCPAPARPVKVLQFGEGNFLRAFVDYMVDIANEKTDFNGSIVLVKPISIGTLFPAFKDQDYRYTVLLRGLEDGVPVEKERVVTSVSDTVDAYTDYDRYAAYAKCETLRFIVSNTTEAGIVLDESDEMAACPPRTYPGKLTKFLYERAEHFDYASDKGLVILPVELIDDNGIELKRCVKGLVKAWGLGEKFEKWLDEACVFTSTLVDRIVTGYPRGEDQKIWEKLGFEDHILVTAEPFGLWVIESEKDISGELPLPQCGLPVIFTDNQKPYKQRKVRILNGAHTSFVPMAFQCGHDIVLEAMNDDLIRNFMEHTLYDEVIPTLSLPKDDLMSFAKAVTGRFQNPFIRHQLLSICLNCVSKWKARCLPSLLGYVEKEKKLPEHLTFSLAAMLELYRGGHLTEDGKLHCERAGQPFELQDDPGVLKFFDDRKSTEDAAIVHDFLSNEAFFGQDLTAVEGLEEYVLAAVCDIEKNGMRCAVEKRFS